MSKFIRNELNQNAMGGSELMMTRLYDSLGDELDDFQIILSRVRELEDGKWRILWCHDLAEDPEAQHLANGGWQKFHMIVFVSNWQRQSYVDRFNIPWSKTVVMQNAIMPFNDPKPGPRIPGVAPIKMIYHTTPHRGLELLYPIVDRLSESHNVQLNVYSSFKVYGWEQRDEPYKDLFKKIEDHPSMTYHGAVDNSEIRAALVGTDIFLYPCIWQETSCLSLIEAMAAGVICVHPDYSVLPETSANWNHIYQWNENPREHANIAYNVIDHICTQFNNPKGAELLINRANMTADYMRAFYNWEIRAQQWSALLKHVKSFPIELPKETGPVFTLRT